MSYKKERRLVLSMLENGNIDPGEADSLLDALIVRTAPRRKALDKVIFEIDAEQDNLRRVVEKLNQAICC